MAFKLSRMRLEIKRLMRWVRRFGKAWGAAEAKAGDHATVISLADDGIFLRAKERFFCSESCMSRRKGAEFRKIKNMPEGAIFRLRVECGVRGHLRVVFLSVYR